VLLNYKLAPVVVQLSGQTKNGYGIIPLNSPGGSTMKWDAERGFAVLGTTF